MTNELLREMALEARRLNNTTEEDATKAPVCKAKPVTDWTITLAEYPDLIVTKTQPKKVSHLVILFTAKTAFIKTGDKSELLTAENYAKFTQGMENIPLPDNYWAPELRKGKNFGEVIISALGNDVYVRAIKSGYFRKFQNSIERERWSDNVSLYLAQALIPKLLEEFKDRPKCMDLLSRRYVMMADIVHRFGIQNARDFLMSYDESLAVFAGDRDFCRAERYALKPCEEKGVALNVEDALRATGVDCYGSRCYSALPSFKMKYDSFKDYVLYDSVRFGYGDDLYNFLDEWCDSLCLQISIYGKIKEKYPDALPLYHNQLSYKARLMREEIDEQNFARQVENAKQYEGKVGKYVFVAPKCKQDFYDEATAQSNCLAGYVKSFTDGNCIILFMRKADAPTTSFVTIEVQNGVVRQAKLARNVNPPREIKELIDEHIARCNRVN